METVASRPSDGRHPTLGVALITLNADAHLARCLTALRFADQIVIVDGGSQDQTLSIAATHGVTVFSQPDWQGFGVQKNRAVAHLTTDWVLLVDADEVVSAPLAASIRATVSANRDAVYSLDRVSSFCGQWIQHSGWRPDHIARLFKRGQARFSNDLVHERLLFEGQPVLLDGSLMHYSYDNIDAVIRKMDSYSAAGARQRHARAMQASNEQGGAPGGKGQDANPGRGLAKAVSRASWAFFRTYVLKRGFLDGGAGFMIATLNAQTVYYRFLRLAELRQTAMRPSND